MSSIAEMPSAHTSAELSYPCACSSTSGAIHPMPPRTKVLMRVRVRVRVRVRLTLNFT